MNRRELRELLPLLLIAISLLIAAYGLGYSRGEWAAHRKWCTTITKVAAEQGMKNPSEAMPFCDEVMKSRR